jgi:hypothetical protein
MYEEYINYYRINGSVCGNDMRCNRRNGIVYGEYISYYGRNGLIYGWGMRYNSRNGIRVLEKDWYTDRI